MTAMRQQKHKQGGFTLPEMLVATGLLALFIPVVINMIQPFMIFYSKIDTDSRLKDLKSALITTYNTYALDIETQTTAVFANTDGTLRPVLPSATRQCSGDSNTFAAVKRFLSTSSTEIYRDGFGRSFCVFITPRLSANYNGVSYYYHNLLVVSPGVDGEVDATTTLNADGTITVGGDDRSIFIDGRSLQLAKLQQSWAQMDKVVSAYQNYFTSRYMVNTSRDTAVNYFANGPASWGTASNWDAGGWVVSTQGTSQALTWNNIYQGLGLTIADVTDTFGQVLTVDNSSDATRNPDNQADVALQSPPYTVILKAQLPGGQTITRTITGTY